MPPLTPTRHELWKCILNYTVYSLFGLITVEKSGEKDKAFSSYNMQYDISIVWIVNIGIGGVA